MRAWRPFTAAGGRDTSSSQSSRLQSICRGFIARSRVRKVRRAHPTAAAACIQVRADARRLLCSVPQTFVNLIFINININIHKPSGNFRKLPAGGNATAVL
jgi:hypothetical protein